MPTLRFPEQFGTAGNDSLTSGSQTITYGLAGDDSLTAKSYSEYNFLAGGAGNDKYYSAQGAAITIYDTGGTDTVYAPRLGVNDPYTYIATVNNGQHLLAFSSYYGDQIAVANWRNPSNSIENIVLSDGTFSLNEIVTAVQQSANNLGDYSIEQLSYVDVLPTGTSSADVVEFMSYISNQEIYGGNPTGNIDEVSSSQIRGWAYDPDDVSQSLDIHIYVDGTFYGAVAANQSRQDLSEITGSYAAHGFEYSLTGLSEGTHTIEVYAINIGDRGDNQKIGTNSVSVTTQTSPSNSDTPVGQHTLTAIANVFGSIMFLNDLTETVTSDSHTIEYNGTTFDYEEVDGFITTVVRDGEFTSEFAAEIAESFPDVAGISYNTALALIGQPNMEGTLLMVAGFDGNYVG